MSKLLEARPSLHTEVSRPTTFHPRVSGLCLTNEWIRWGGYTTVNAFDDVELEYFAIRNQSTVFDVSPMNKYRVHGPDAERFMNRLLTRDVRKIAPGRVGYCVWCDDAGHVLDDGTVFRFSETEFRLCCQERQYLWLWDSAVGFDVTIDDVSDEVAGLSLQGPTSFAVLERMGLGGVAALRPFDMKDFEFGGGSLTVSRTGFTGDLGYELWVPPERALELWDALWEAGRLHGLRPIGSAALDLARIEAGFIATNVDFVAKDHALRPNRGRSPFELGLGWLVNFDKGHFTGRRALLEEREKGSRYHVVGLEVAGSKPAHSALVYVGKATQVGAVTSAMWSPTGKRNIAIATLKRPYDLGNEALWTEIYVNKEGKWEKVVAPCHITERPFFKTPRRSAMPPSDH
jgi:aminomethyltransferase